MAIWGEADFVTELHILGGGGVVWVGGSWRVTEGSETWTRKNKQTLKPSYMNWA